MVDLSPLPVPDKILSTYLENSNANIERLIIGLTWTSCLSSDSAGKTNLGLAMSPGILTRVLPWPGTLAQKPTSSLSSWLQSWNFLEATAAMAALNSVLNTKENNLIQQAEPIPVAGNLAVFSYFKPRLQNKKVVIIGRYPGLDTILEGINYTVLERSPGDNDLPDTAAEYLLPEADWVFVTSTSLINKSFARLCTLAEHAVTVLMGPTTPWLKEWSNYSVDFVAGTEINNPDKAEQIVMEGGGKVLFDSSVKYKVADISLARMTKLKDQIASLYSERHNLKEAMDRHYASGSKSRFPYWQKLDETDQQLSKLDLAYKRLWDAKNPR